MELNDDNKNLYSSDNFGNNANNVNNATEQVTYINGVPNYNAGVYAEPAPTHPTASFNSGVNYGAMPNSAPSAAPVNNQQAPINNRPVNQGLNVNAPVTLGEWIATLILMCIPCVGTILLLVWAFSSTEKVSKKNFAQAALIVKAIGIVLGIIGSVSMFATIMTIIEDFMY